jgi:2-polyprenyl-3-methyl-5-hydroxy-6-metoxy-1,4-benzoquinol methylase
MIGTNDRMRRAEGDDPSGGLAPGFAGGTPELWSQYMAEDEVNAVRPFPSAPDRALLESALRLTGLRRGETVLELGCGSSAFLTRMGAATGARVAGVDFSPEGIERTRAALKGLGIDDSGLALAAIDDYAPDHEGEFDVVVSFGLIEHFADLRSIVEAHFACAKVGGRVFIAAPNLSRVNLAWIKAVAPSLLGWHRPIEARQVAALMSAYAGPDVTVEHRGGFRLFAHPDRAARRPGRTAAALIRKGVNGLGEASYRLAPRAAERAAGAWISPFFAVAATKPERPPSLPAGPPP